MSCQHTLHDPVVEQLGVAANSGENASALIRRLLVEVTCGAFDRLADICGNRAWFNASDARLKDRVVDLGPERGLDGIMKLRPVRYEWKDAKSAGKHELGFLAQDVETVFPELAGFGPDVEIALPDGSTEKLTEVKSMSYGQVVVPLVKAVQELKADNDNLRSANDELRASVMELRSANDNLEARLEKLEGKLE